MNIDAEILSTILAKQIQEHLTTFYNISFIMIILEPCLRHRHGSAQQIQKFNIDKL